MEFLFVFYYSGDRKWKGQKGKNTGKMIGFKIHEKWENVVDESEVCQLEVRNKNADMSVNEFNVFGRFCYMFFFI